MRLLSINTHSIIEENYREKRKQFVECVAKLQPDIIAMQEVNQTMQADEASASLQAGRFVNGKEQKTLKADNHAAMVAAELMAVGLPYDWCWLPMKAGFSIYDEGLALLSKKKIVQTDVKLLSHSSDFNNWRTRYALGIRTAGTNDWFYSVHFGWWKDETESFKEQWGEFQKTAAAKGDKARVFLMGDFNSPAEARGEGYDLVKESGWHDTYLAAAKKDSGITVKGIIAGWEDKLDNAANLEGMRIDYIWCNKEVKALESRSCFNGKTEPVISDHFGVLLDLED